MRTALAFLSLLSLSLSACADDCAVTIAPGVSGVSISGHINAGGHTWGLCIPGSASNIRISDFEAVGLRGSAQ